MKKTGILTFHRAINYGAVLQSYALQQTVASLGADCEIVDYICPRIVSDYKPFRIGKKNPLADFVKSCIMFRRRANRAKAFQSFFNNCLVKSARSYTPETLTEAKKEYDVLITGSDQVWSPNCVGFDPAYFLTFADSRQKYSYAASFAVTELPKERVDEYKSRLKDFQAYSVREKSGEKLVKQLTGKTACTHPDPTLLLGKEAWSKIGVRKCDKPYILIFTANPPVELVDYACRLAKEKNLPVLTCGFSPTCSVTISGKNDKGAVICFQREIKLAEETVIEAGERVMSRKGCNDDCVLMLRAALGILLFGDSFFDSFV